MQMLGKLSFRRSGRSIPLVDVTAAASEAREAGDRLRDEKCWTEAASLYRKHLREHPDDFAIWVQAGNCLKEGGAFAEALAAYRRAIALDRTGDADVFLQLGHLHKLMGNESAAIEAYRSSLAREPHENPARMELLVLGVNGADRAQSSHDAARSFRIIQNQLDRLIDEHRRLRAPRIQEACPVTNNLPQPVQQCTIWPMPMASTVFILVDTANFEGDLLPLYYSSFPCLGDRRVVFVCWSAESKRLQLLTRSELEQFRFTSNVRDIIECYPEEGATRLVIESFGCGKDDWILVPVTSGSHEFAALDVVLEAKRLGIRSAFISSGVDPLRCGSDVDYERFAQALLLADAILPASDAACDDLVSYFIHHQKASSGPFLRTIAMPSTEGPHSSDRWSEYFRLVITSLAEAADDAWHLKALYLVRGADQEHEEFATYLARGFIRNGIKLVFVRWSEREARLVPAGISHSVAISPTSEMEWLQSGESDSQRWLVIPNSDQVILVPNLLTYARNEGLRTAVILDRPAAEMNARDGCSEQILFEAVASADKILAVSEKRFQDFYRFLLSWRGKVHSAEHRFKVVSLPDEVPERPRRVAPRRPAVGVVHVVVIVSDDSAVDLAILMYGLATAARKSSERLVFAVTSDSQSIGGPQGGIRSSVLAGMPEQQWDTGGKSLDQILDDADFAIFTGWDPDAASAVAKCRWRAVPCLVHRDRQSLAGIAVSGTAAADLRRAEAFAEAVLKYIKPEWRQCLSREAVSHRVRTWDEYAMEIAIELATDQLADGVRRLPIGEPESGLSTRFSNLPSRPKLSVCITTYNRGGWIDLNLKNIFSQITNVADDLEVLVVDNTSTDHTPEVVKPYLDRPDFRYIRNPKNVGMLGNLAVTAQSARGEHIWILGDDDFPRRGTIGRVVQILNERPGLPLIYINYGYTSEPDPANVTDLPSFLDAYNVLHPAGHDEFGSVKQLAAKCENFFTAIYSHVYRRDHALKAYCQDTSGRIFSTMLSCVPTAYYVLNYMADEPAYWIGEPALVVNSNVSWQAYGALLDLEQLPRAWDLAERMGTDPAEVDKRRANRLWLVEMMWREIFDNDAAGNSAYFSAARVLMRLKHLSEIDKHIPEMMAVYERAFNAGHPAAVMPISELFSAFQTREAV